MPEEITIPTTEEMLLAVRRMTNVADLETISRTAEWRLRNMMRFEFRPFDEVKFTDRGGREIIGVVRKVNSKTVTVADCKTAGGMLVGSYRVPPRMLEKVGG